MSGFHESMNLIKPHPSSRKERPDAEFMTYNFVEVPGHNLESSQNLGFHKHVYITKQFQPTFVQGGYRGKSVVEVNANSKKENY
jgi:hypothetical protein